MVEEADVEDAVVAEEEAVVEEVMVMGEDMVAVGTSGEVMTDMIVEEEEAGGTLTDTTVVEAEEEIADHFRVVGEEISIARQGLSKEVMNGNVF